jgi:tetratricopeptide (TPR) repeat protein
LQAHAADGEGARETLRAVAAQGLVSPALIRDRFDLSVGGDVVGLRALAAEAAAAWPQLTAWPLALLLAATARFDRRLVDPRIAPTPAGLEDDARALHAWLEEVLEQGKAKGPEDPVLSLVAERAAEAPGEVETRLKLFRSWAALDPARRAPAWSAASSLSHEARRPEELTAALRPLVDDDQGHPGFWWLAEKDAAAGRYEEAAARFEAAAEAWRASALAPWLRERAAEWRAGKHPARALEALEILARAAEGAEGVGVRATWLRLLRAAADLLVAGGLRTGTFEAAADAEEQASIWARVSLTTGSFDAIEAALSARPADPQALALLMTSDRDVPDRLADELVVSARAADGESAVVLGLLAATWRALAGEDDRARAMIRDLVGQVGGHPAVDGFLRRAARAVPDPHLRARLLFFARGAEDDPESVEGEAAGPALELAEALMAIEEPAAERLLRRLAYGSAALEARLSFLRLKGSLADLGQLWGWDPRRGFPGRLSALSEKVPLASSEEAARLVLEAPPFESQAGLRTRAWALLALPAAEAPDALAALLAEADRERRPAFALRWRALGEAREPATRALVLSAFAEVLGRSAAAAALWVEAGGLYEAVDRRAEAQKAYERAHQADPHAFCALTGLRRLAVANGDLAQAAGWAEQEDLLLDSPQARVRVLLSSARVASAAGRDEMALQLLQRAFSLAPEDSEVFTRLGDRLEALGRHQELADLLADRLMVTRNPFEVTSLRLRRAETLAGPLGNSVHARHELESVLQKEPDHARALVDLASLLEKDGAFAEAAELLVRRAVKERDPERLGALYLRLGDIYRERLGDERRALGAYLRVLQIDPRHRASLAAAAELQARLDPRAAMGLVERLLALGLEPEPERHWRIRLGQLQEQAQDFRQAAANLRRAWDQPPTNLTALRELARFLERVRDERGRRALWEEAQERLTTEALDPSGAGSGVDAWRGLFEVAQQRQRPLAARFAGQMAATLAAVEPNRPSGLSADLAAAFDGRGVLARLLRDPEAEDKLYRALAPAVSSGLRALLRSVAPHLAHERRLDLRVLGLTREERQPKGELRDVVTALAHEAGVSDPEVFVKAGPHPTAVYAASPQALILGAPVARLGGMALKFAAARAAYLLATGHAFLLTDDAGGAALFLAGLVRVFVPSFVHPGLPELVTEQRSTELGRALPKKKKSDLVPFAWEAAGAFDIDALRDGIRAVADAVGLLACGHLPSALAVLVTEEGGKGDAASVRQVKDARALATFALSWELDDLWRGWG